MLPFNGIDFRLSPGGVALDKAGDVYVTSEGMYGRVVELPPGSSTPTVLPFNGLYQPQGLAVDGAGAVYVADFNNRVVKLAAGSNAQIGAAVHRPQLPRRRGGGWPGQRVCRRPGQQPGGEVGGRVERADRAAVHRSQEPRRCGGGSAGNVYVTDTDNNRVLKLAAGSNAQTVFPFGDVAVPWGIAVDNAGDVFVTEHDSNQVLKLAAGSNTPTVLPLTGLNTPLAVTVDNTGNVYVADRGNDRAVKLAP